MVNCLQRVVAFQRFVKHVSYLYHFKGLGYASNTTTTDRQLFAVLYKTTMMKPCDLKVLTKGSKSIDLHRDCKTAADDENMQCMWPTVNVSTQPVGCRIPRFAGYC